jgi:hypothetical protein
MVGTCNLGLGLLYYESRMQSFPPYFYTVHYPIGYTPFNGCMFLDFLVVALLDENIQNWNKMIHLMCIRVPTYVGR